MRYSAIALSLFVISGAVLAQTNLGTITGTIVDPAGAVVANAMVEAKNTATNATYPVASSTTGNYTIPNLPAGTYELTVTSPGFKQFVRTGLTVQAAQTIRVDATLAVGAATEEIAVNAEAPLLKTESGELSQTVSIETIDQLPLLYVGADNSGIRNPYSTVALLPGALWQNPNNASLGLTVAINGNPSASETTLIDGMNGTNIMAQTSQQENAPGTDSIQEWTAQTNNYSAEYGQTGGAVMNVTMKSGTNEFHGSLYEYMQNEFMNAGNPFTNNGNGSLVRPQERRNDYGLTLGGPIWIPKIYNGRNKTFFFFGWEQFLQGQTILPTALSVPTAAYRNGDFSAAIAAAGNTNLGTDPLGRPIMANEIYDPATRSVAPNGLIVTNPFPNNAIPLSRMDPVSLKIQSLIPMPFCAAGGTCNPAGVVNNFQNPEYSNRKTEIPSLKLDEIIGPRDKLSFYWSRTDTDCLTCYGEDGLPQPVSDSFGAAIYSSTERLNYDHTISPTLLLHLGVGWNYDDLGRPTVTPSYNSCSNLGLCSPAFQYGATLLGDGAQFPELTGLYNGQGGGFGSTALTPAPLGPPGRTDDIYSMFNNIASLSWVTGNHSFKFGGSLDLQGYYRKSISALQGIYGFAAGETALPYLVNTSTGHSVSSIGPYSVGFPYASFLLGAVDTATINPPSEARFGKHQLALYAQDSWKVKRNFTLDYGLRYDYGTYYREQYGRAPDFAPTLPDPTAGGHPGSVIYQATCHCQFAHNYPWAFGPRLGFAYQVTPKWVLRGGFGIVYSPTSVADLFTSGAGNAIANNPFGPPSVPGQPLMTWSQGVTLNGAPITPAQIAWPNFSTGFYPIGGIIPGTGPQYYDQNAGRPARQYQWSFSVQRELTPNLVVQASYVGNRGIWWPSYVDEGGSISNTNGLVNYNYLSTAILNHYGLSLNNPADLAILLAPIGSPAAGRFQNQLPFPGFPLTATVAQSLRPFPQYNAGLTPINAPLGDTWYDALQASATKRFSHGLDATFGFTWSKALNTFGGTPDVQNLALAKGISEYNQPLMLRVSFDYTLPKWGPKLVSAVVRDWTLNGFGLWASGLPLVVPATNTTGYPAGLASATMNNLTFQPNQYQIPTGQPFYLVDINCHCYNPTTTFVLNPAAWADPAPGQYGGARYYDGFRQNRRPVENFGVGRTFRMRERASLSLRVEFTNIFNRVELNAPTTVGPQTAPVCIGANGRNGACSAGQTIVSGFGSISTLTTAAYPRQGQLVAQFKF